VRCLTEISNFWYARFNKEVNFGNAQFNRASIFRDAKLKSSANFMETYFGGDVTFMGAEFGEDVNFGYIKFGGDVNFRNTKFGKDFHENSYAPSIRFNTNSNKNKSISGSSDIDFRYCKFDGKVYFEDSRFYLDANFYAVWFGKEFAKFQDVRFKGNASFKAATFPRFANFMSAWFRGNADFTEAKFTGDARFDDAHIDKNIILTGARIGTMALNNCQFKKESEILLKEAIFNRLYIKWDSLKMHLKYKYEDGYDWATYSALVKNFRDLVRFNDADDCYYDFRKRHQDTKNWSIENTSRISRFNWSKLYDWIGLRSCGYGTKLSFSFIWVVIFAVITLYTYNKYGSDNLRTICFGLFLSGIVLPLFIVVLARKLIR